MESQAAGRTVTVNLRRKGHRFVIAFALMVILIASAATPGIAEKSSAAASPPWSACTNGLNVSGSPRDFSTGARLNAVSAPTASDAWVVGEGATPLVEHWDGSVWTVIPVDLTSIEPDVSLMQATLNAVVAFSPTDVWVGGTQQIFTQYGVTFVPLLLRWNGSVWLQENLPLEDEAVGVAALAGTSGGDLWVAEDEYYSGNSVIWHRSGSSWGWQSADITVQALFAYAPGFVIAGGQTDQYTAATINFDGAGSFAPTADPGSSTILALSGTGLDDLWAFALPATQGAAWELQHYDGSSWTNVAPSWGTVSVASVGTDKAEAVLDSAGFTQAVQVSVTDGSVVTSETPLTWDPSLGIEIDIDAMASTPRGALFAVGDIWGNRNPQGIVYRDC